MNRRLHEMDWTRHRLPASGTATVVTPPSSVAVLRAGHPVRIDGGAC